MQALYLERRTWLHAVPALVKLLLLATIGSALFLTDDAGLLLAAAFGAVALLSSLGPMGAGAARLVRMVAVAALLVGAFHAVAGSVAIGISSASRVLAMALSGLAITSTTHHREMLDLFERLLSPLARVGVRVDHVALQLALMVRFTEHFFVQWKRLDDAHRLRTGRPGRIRILAPLVIQMLLAARRVGDALHLRWP